MTEPQIARTLLEKHGVCRRQIANEWSGNFSLPSELLDFYLKVGPEDVVVEGYGNPTEFPSLANLWRHQMGYRYHPDTNDDFPDWDKSWIVVANEGGDAYIYADGIILYAEHGTGEWMPEQIFDNIYTMTAVIAMLGTVVTEAGLDLTDEDSYILPKYRALAVERLDSILGSRIEAESFVAFAGWG